MERDGDSKRGVGEWCLSWDQMQFERDRASGWGGRTIAAMTLDLVPVFIFSNI